MTVYETLRGVSHRHFNAEMNRLPTLLRNMNQSINLFSLPVNINASDFADISIRECNFDPFFWPQIDID